MTEQYGQLSELVATTPDRQGLVGEVSAAAQMRISLQLQKLKGNAVPGERIDLSAAADYGGDLVWQWNQISGPPVELWQLENSASFVVPATRQGGHIRIGVFAEARDTRSRSRWHFFDIDIDPVVFQLAHGPINDYGATLARIFGYERGLGEIWNEALPPASFNPLSPDPVKQINLGIAPGDVFFGYEEPDAAPAGAIFVDLSTMIAYRNLGDDYGLEDADRTSAPRRNAYWVNPDVGVIYQWIED